jgi:dihydropyrimidine dehydrogenase (NAD+) subunit PreT
MPFTELVEKNGLAHSNGKINVNGHASTMRGVFAGGDCVNGGKEVVDAVQAGKEGAREILEYLNTMLNDKC